MPRKAMLLSALGYLARFSVVGCLIEHGGVSKRDRGVWDLYMAVSDTTW